MDFNQKTLAKVLPSEKVQTIFDPATPALCLKITPAGSKCWYYVYRMGGRGTKQKWLKVGEFQAKGKQDVILPLNRAQELARTYRTKVDAGIDPAKEILEANTLGETIAGLAKKYKAEVLIKKSQSTQEGYGGSIDLHIIPGLGKLAVRSISRDQVMAWHSKIPYPIAANRALSVLRLMMNLAIDVWGMRPDQINPARKIERNDEQPRKRDVEMDELRAIGQAIRDLEGKHSLWALAAVHVAALCWGRVSEVLSLRRDKDVNLDGGYAILKQHKTVRKTGIRRLELPPAAVAILRSLPEQDGNPFYFPGRFRNRPMTRDGLHKTWMAVREKAGIEDIHIHDFRSLADSEAEDQGIAPAARAVMLGHSEATAKKHYTKARRVKEAAAMVSAPIARALEGKGPKKKR